MRSDEVRPGRPREYVQARLPGGRLLDAAPGTSLAKLLAAAGGDGAVPAVAAVVDGRLQELSATLDVDARVVPVTPADVDGARIYRRSLVLLLVTAAGELFPEASLFVQHAAAAAAGFFCEVRGRGPFSPDELARIEERMREIVAEDAPIARRLVPAEEAAELFRARGEEDKARLLGHRDDPVHVYTLRGCVHYPQGFLVPSAGALRRFALRAFPPGFMLCFPHQSRPDQLVPAAPYPKLFATFAEAGRWLDRLGIRGAGTLADAIEAGRLSEICLVAEALHEARIAQIAQGIAEAHERIRVVLVAGPSASGKTSFAKRLAVQLLARGVRPVPLGLDEYYRERHDVPLGASGRPDYDGLDALDRGLLQAQIAALLAGDEVAVPHYDFRTGGRREGPRIRLGADNVLIVEGIHGLNPDLLPGLPTDRLRRVYVSALTQLNLDRHNRVSTTDTRLIRRIVRDAAFRGYSAQHTLASWDAVTRGEKLNIFPFQENADDIFNSSLVYELAVLRPRAEPLLLQVRQRSHERLEANRLLSFLQWFRPADAEPVPSNSILREFVGGSTLERFRLWPIGMGDGLDS